MPDTPPTAAARPRLKRGLVLLFAVATGLSVANLYYAQPLLDTIARDLGAGSGSAGLVVTFSQIGYAVGLALLVPLGDILTRRRLIPAVMVMTAAALIAAAAAPAIGVLIAVAAVIGAGSVVAQILVPMAASLADEEHRGKVVGTVTSGLLLGILLARTASGLVAGVSSWRVVYIAASAVTIVMAVTLSRLLPAEQERPRIGYAALLGTVVKLFVTQPVLRRRSLIGALGFAAFSAFWTTLAFLLTGAPYHYGEITIGLFGLIGAGGALCANFAGRWADQGKTRATTLAFTLCLAVSFLLLWYGRRDLAMLIIGIIALDLGSSGLLVTNQSVIYRLAPQARSRVNSAYMVCYFTGGAIGSALGGSIYGSYGWTGLCFLGGGIAVAVTAVAVMDAAHRPSAPSPVSDSEPALISTADTDPVVTAVE
jgi:predicted MFS family arabinose efflux permease